ncbi:hypothetical protein Tco_0783651 [Tanacetum coccineum]
MYTFPPMMVANSRKHHCCVRTYTREVLVLSTNLEIQTKHCPLVFRNRRGDEARIKKTWYNQGPLAHVYDIIVAAGITKSSKVQEQYPELEVRPKLIPCGHKCMMEAQKLWQWMKFNANLLKVQILSLTMETRRRLPLVTLCVTVPQTLSLTDQTQGGKCSNPSNPGLSVATPPMAITTRVAGASAASSSSLTDKIFPLGAQCPLTRNTKPKVVPVKQWKPTGRLISLGGQCPLVRSAALNRGTMPADPQGNNTHVEYNLVCSNQQDPNCN